MSDRKAAADMAVTRASDLLVSEDKRVELMIMVKEGKITPEKAMEKVLAMDRRLQRDADKERKEKEATLARMTPKARQQELKLRAQQKATEEKQKLTIRQHAYITSPLTNQEIRAEEMTLTEKDRIDIMYAVKEGNMTVDQAMRRVKMKEQRMNEQRFLEEGSSSAPASPDHTMKPLGSSKPGKRLRFKETNPSECEIWETYTNEEYDRKHAEDYDPETARRIWEEEEVIEERERQLEDRWAVIESSMPEGAQCDERIEYNTKKKLAAEMEAAAEKKKQERREASKRLTEKLKSQRDWSKIGKSKDVKSKMMDEILQLNLNIAEVQSFLAGVEREKAQQEAIDAMAKRYKDVVVESSDDEPFELDIEAEMARIRAEAREQAAASSMSIDTTTVSAKIDNEAPTSPNVLEGIRSTESSPTMSTSNA